MKQRNQYSVLVNIDRIPKSVLAAIVVSEYINRLNIAPDELQQAIEDEWTTLYQQGIVPQRPILSNTATSGRKKRAAQA